MSYLFLVKGCHFLKIGLPVVIFTFAQLVIISTLLFIKNPIVLIFYESTNNHSYNTVTILMEAFGHKYCDS